MSKTSTGGSTEAVSREERIALGARLREAREYLGFRQGEVARSLGIARTALSNIERGTRGVDALELKKLADLYHRPTQYFIGEKAATADSWYSEISHLARAVSQLSSQDKEELARFADYLSARSKSKHSQND